MNWNGNCKSHERKVQAYFVLYYVCVSSQTLSCLVCFVILQGGEASLPCFFHKALSDSYKSISSTPHHCEAGVFQQWLNCFH